MDYIVERIKHIIEEKGLSASEFADTIGVKKATLSHVLSGRNKPSLEFVMRIIESFEDVNPELLLQREWSPAKEDKQSEAEAHPDTMNDRADATKGLREVQRKNEIDRIVIFYKDLSFTEYKNEHDS